MTTPADWSAFVFSVPGLRHGRVVQWSHMLGVTPAARGQALGLRLKLAQRERALARGIDLVEWTYDPLLAGNARLNVHRLGCVVEAYLDDVYGPSTSPLHGGLPTDRFIASWHVASPHVARRVEAGAIVARDAGVGQAPHLLRTREAASFRAPHGEPDLSRDEPRLRVEIPADFARMLARRRSSRWPGATPRAACSTPISRAATASWTSTAGATPSVRRICWRCGPRPTPPAGADARRPAAASAAAVRRRERAPRRGRCLADPGGMPCACQAPCAAAAAATASAWPAPISMTSRPPGRITRRRVDDQPAHDVQAVRTRIERRRPARGARRRARRRGCRRARRAGSTPRRRRAGAATAPVSRSPATSATRSATPWRRDIAPGDGERGARSIDCDDGGIGPGDGDGDGDAAAAGADIDGASARARARRAPPARPRRPARFRGAGSARRA